MIKFPKLFNTNNAKLDTVNLYTVDAINQSLKAVFYSNKGELLGDPTYGTDLIKRVFELKTNRTLTDVKEIIIETIAKYIPTISVGLSDITIYDNPNNSAYKINIKYVIKSFNTVGEFETIIN